MQRVTLPAILAFAITLLASGSALAQGHARNGAGEPAPRHAAAAQLIAELLSHYHYRNHAIDDQFSKKAFAGYFDTLDPQRFFFRAGDIERFAEYRTRLDDGLRQGELGVAWEIFRLYRERVAGRAAFVADLLQQPLDLTGTETLLTDRTEAAWPADEASQNALWRKRIKNDVLSTQLDSEQSNATIRDELVERYQQLAANLRQYNADDVFEIYMNAWASLYDPHTSYLSPRTRENFDINMSLSLQGIGALLRADGNYTEIVELVQGGPAAKQGELQVGDRITGVAQGEEPFTNVIGWRLPDVVDLIRGPKGSTVRLRVLPAADGENVRKTLSIVRNEIVLEDQAAQSRILQLDAEGGESGRIGVIEIPSFYHDFEADKEAKRARSTTMDVRALLADLRANERLDGLVVDLRNNSGGSLQEATEMVGLFIDQGPIVQIRYSDGELNVLGDRDNGDIAYRGPLTVLVNRFSASASEIFAAAIQDYDRGLVIGQQTFGKGTVQDLVDLNRYRLAGDGRSGSLKFTRAKYYRVTGGSTQRRGVRPDISLGALMPAPPRVTERSEPRALPWDEIDPVSFTARRHDAALIDRLRRDFEQRLQSNPALQALHREVALGRASRADDHVVLNAEKRRTDRNQREARRISLVNKRLAALGLEPVSALAELEQRDVPDLVLQEAGRLTLGQARWFKRHDGEKTLSASAPRRRAR